METAKANNLRLEGDIEHLLTVLPERLVADPNAGIDDLLPWADAIQKRFALFGTGDRKANTGFSEYSKLHEIQGLQCGQCSLLVRVFPEAPKLRQTGKNSREVAFPAGDHEK
ncbi:MAG: transposase domain-containing protein [Clostridia bacterium]|nr:transposase domain-containing protein [Clostridia bacterium]